MTLLKKVVSVWVFTAILILHGCSYAQTAGDAAAKKGTQKFKVGGWLVSSWDYQNSLRSLTQNADIITEVSPVWFKVGPDGQAVNRNGDGDKPAPAGCEEQVEAVCKQYGIKLIPLISNSGKKGFDRELVSKIINSSRRRKAHVAGLTNLVLRRGYDGLEIDYELLKNGDRDAFSVFIRELAKSLHKKGKLLVIAVHRKEAEPGDDWGGYGPMAHDWKTLGQVVDIFRIMAYDQHWGAGSTPGAIGGLAWTQKALDFAVTVVPPEKIELGVPTYGYDWEVATKKAENFDPVQFPAYQKQYGVKTVWDESAQEPMFAYTKDGKKHEVWYEDARCLVLKLEAAKKAGIRGISIWRLGSEETAFWDNLRNFKNQN